MMLLIPLPLELLPLNVTLTLTFPVYHLLLALSFNDLPISGIPLAVLVHRLRRRMLHSLANSWQRMTATV
jgi:type III secretory pathway component EscV